MPTKFEQERDQQRLAQHQRVAGQIKETDRQMSRETSRTLLLYTGDIVPDPEQPRRLYEDDKAALQELAASIRNVGLLSPIQVRPDPHVVDQYIIIVGERRWRASQLAGVNRIEAVVRDGWDIFQIRAAQYEENEKREDVSDVARARSLMAMRDAEASSKRRGWEEVAARVGLQRNQAMRLVGLLQLPEPVVEMIDRRFLPGTHGTELARLLKRVSEEEIIQLARACATKQVGGKARLPVKELSRIITERLQAAYEATQGSSGEAGAGLADSPAASPQAEAGSTAAASHVEGGPVPGNSGGIEPPRPFVLEVAQAWRAGSLRSTERSLLQDLLERHPLREVT